MSETGEHAEKFREAAQIMSKEKAENRRFDSNSYAKRKDGISLDFLVSALRALAWVALVAGVIGGFLLWSSAPHSEGALRSLRTQSIIHALTMAIQGFAVWVFFYALSIMAETLEEIREKLLRGN